MMAIDTRINVYYSKRNAHAYTHKHTHTHAHGREKHRIKIY